MNLRQPNLEERPIPMKTIGWISTRTFGFIAAKYTHAKRSVILVVLLTCLIGGCGGRRPAVAPPSAPVVTVEYPVIRSLASLGEFTGRLEAVESQVIQAQASGYLREIKFKDGAIVQPGDILYEIEDEPYEAALMNTKAIVAKSASEIATIENQLRLATADFERAKALLPNRAISQQEFDEKKTTFDTATTALMAANANLEAAKASQRKAEFDLVNCTIRSGLRSPGRVTRTEITPGNLVVAGQTVLCKIVSLNPIYAYWDVDESTSLAYRRKIFDEKSLPDPRGDSKLSFWVGLRDEKKGADGKWPHAGWVDYIAPEIIRGSGTREIRGVLANDNYRLSPGDSVRVQVTTGPEAAVLTIPEIAIGSQQQQKYVFVVVQKEGRSIAEFRPIRLGPVYELGGVRVQVVPEGLREDEPIIVNGLLRVRPGAEVQPQTQTSKISPSP